MPALVPIARAQMRTFLPIDPGLRSVLAAGDCGTSPVSPLTPRHRLGRCDAASRSVGRRHGDHDQRPAMILSCVRGQSLWRVDDGRH